MKASTSPFSEPSINSASEAIALLGLTPRFQPDIANQPPKCSGSNAPPSAATLQGDPWAAPSVRVIWPDGAQTRLADGQGGPTATHPADLPFLVTGDDDP